MDASRTYARRDGPNLIEVRRHPGFVDWAGQRYAIIAADDGDPHPTWSIIPASELLGPWDRTTSPA